MVIFVDSSTDKTPEIAKVGSQGVCAAAVILDSGFDGFSYASSDGA